MTFHDYQLRSIKFIKDKKRCALYLGMGLGKTLISLTSIQQLLEESKINKVLIIAPLRVANSVWHNEILKWDHLKNLTYCICTGSSKQRLKALSENVNIYIINRENVSWLLENNLNKFDMIILDESSSFKNPSSARFKALKKFKYEYLIELTGTPSPNGLLDIWSQIYLLDKGERLGKSFYEYKFNHFVSDYMGYNFTPRDPNKIYSLISDITMSMKVEDYLCLPNKIELKTIVDIPCIDKYKELKKKLILEINNSHITSFNAGVLSNKLLQFCNGAIYDELGETIELHSAKIDALIDIIDNNPNENFLIAYNYKSDLVRLKNKFKHAIVLDNQDQIIKDWNEGKIKLLLCHPASAGKGINLQHGGNIIIWFGLTWNLEDYLQFNARLYRQGQQKPVIINHIIAKDCIDEIVLQSLQKKDKIQNNLLNYLIKDNK